MKFFGRTAGYNLFDHKRNEEILEELKIELVDEKRPPPPMPPHVLSDFVVSPPSPGYG